MKIVKFSSGLGNQVFYYLFYLFLKNKYPNESIYGYYLKKDLKNHNGLEVNKVFAIDLPKATFLSNLVSLCCHVLYKLGIKHYMEPRDPCRKNAILYCAYYQDQKYFLDNIAQIKFRKIDLDEKNKQILELILNTNSVSLHVRRGDYLNVENIKIYGNIATKDYYREAIKKVCSQINNPYFFIFSNDIEWCQKNLDIKNAVFVQNNSGANSYIDMFLMSKCKGNILANSSFSYWGAMLNENDNQIVIYPQKWNNISTPDIFPQNWIGL